MSEFPPAGAIENSARDYPEALTPEAIEYVLDDFRKWLEYAATQGRAELSSPVDQTVDAVDLHTLLAQFTALRHEVHLQTRGIRGQQEQNAETLRQLSEALQLVRQQQATATASNGQEGDRLRPLLKTLLDVADALGLAAREVRRVQESMRAALEELTSALKQREAVSEAPLPSSSVQATRSTFWTRWLGVDHLFAEQRQTIAALQSHLTEERQHRRQREEKQQHQLQTVTERMRLLLDSMLTGYTMSLQRVERTLEQQGLEPILTTGERFDPEYMEVLEVVTNSDRPSGEVVEEVRRGYLWQGRVFRYAQVRVAKSSIPS